MAREELQNASAALREAAADATDAEVEERLYDQSKQLADLAAAERGPDHGRLARHENALHELIDATEGDAQANVEVALESVQEYRSGVEGV
jgi:hypothetical protein